MAMGVVVGFTVSWLSCGSSLFFFFFQAEDGIRDVAVTGVQTCALPILYETQQSGQNQHGSGQNEQPLRDRQSQKLCGTRRRIHGHIHEVLHIVKYMKVSSGIS